MMQEFVAQVHNMAKKAMEEMHTALPGKVIAFDAGTGLATVQPVAMFNKPNGETMDFPTVSGVPVVFPQSGGVTVAWSIKAGDGCLLVFAESAIDYWMYGKETDTSLKFDLSNAIAIPGLSTVSNAAMQKACTEDAVVIRSGETTLTVKSKGVVIDGNVTINGSLTTEGVVIDGDVTINGSLTTQGGTVNLN